MLSRIKSFIASQRGTTAVIVALLMVVLVGILALAVDIGRLLAAKSEMQKAADAGALAGARALVPYIGAGNSATPNWTSGTAVATQTARLNKVEDSWVADVQTQAYYYNLGTKALAATTITPTSLDCPAIQVTLSKTSGANGGPITNFFTNTWGITTSSITNVQAMAIISSPGVVDAGSCFPLATPITWVQQHWNDDPPTTFKIGSSYHSPDGGQWTSFLLDVNNVPAIRDLIDSGNPGPIKVGDQIWIEPGTKTTLYVYAQSRIGQTVLLPVVPDDFDTHAHTTLLAFAPFYIEDAVGGSGKYIQGHFNKNYPSMGDTPGGSYYGAFIPPKLVK
jgi:Flp pilus assembly protein TadG